MGRASGCGVGILHGVLVYFHSYPRRNRPHNRLTARVDRDMLNRDLLLTSSPISL